MKPEQHILNRTTSSCRSSRKVIPSNYPTSSSLIPKEDKSILVQQKHSPQLPLSKPKNVTKLLQSLLNILSIPNFLPSCRWLAISSKLSPSSSTLGRHVTGTLFGHRKGHVTFAVQEDPRSDPVLLLELATSTSTLVKEMSSGLVRIALECKVGFDGSNGSNGPGVTRPVKLFQEPMWTMYCNGKKCGYAMSRTCGECDWDVLSTVQTVSVGAGVIPVDTGREKNGSWEGGGGEVMYMRARFERVVGSKDSEAFYMMNPDGSGGPEFSIFLLRI